VNAVTETVALERESRRGGVSVAIDSIYKQFTVGRDRTVAALAGISLDIEAGHFVAVVGPSGCGKSTLLRLIAGLEQPDAGFVTIDGGPPMHLAAEHMIGVAFQDHALLPWLSVRQNIALPYHLAGVPLDVAHVDALLALVGLADFGGVRPAQLSGGMRQRVSIARSLALKPRLLLLDEPFGALDLVTRRGLNLEMQRVWDTLGTTTLLITHSVDEAVQLAERVIVMTARPGRVHAQFTIGLERPRTRETTQSDAFSEYVRRISAALDDVMMATSMVAEGGSAEAPG
jgi:NitT/TauT family transport system ATP-binding protein